MLQNCRAHMYCVLTVFSRANVLLLNPTHNPRACIHLFYRNKNEAQSLQLPEVVVNRKPSRNAIEFKSGFDNRQGYLAEWMRCYCIKHTALNNQIYSSEGLLLMPATTSVPHTPSLVWGHHRDTCLIV